ncbi:MAG: hypothetical protein H0U57_08440 [Tatlockia sp.]|nr:hypothetical protein [Tatlockia sp.]
MREKQAIASFINESENTMNRVVSNSVGMALVKLSQMYFGKKVNTGTQVSSLFQACMVRIREQAENYYGSIISLNAPVEDMAARGELVCNYLEDIAQEPTGILDRVTLFSQDAQSLKAKDVQYYFPLKEVIVLVWLALEDRKQYQTSILLNEDKEDNQHRLASFFLCVEKLRTNPVCHQGTRHELVFLLNKIYKDINLIEDADATVFYTLKEQLTQQFIESYKNASETLKKLLLSVFINAISSNNFSLLSKQIDPDQTAIINLKNLFIAHGTNPKVVQLERLIEDALKNLELALDSNQFPELYYTQLIVKEFIDLPIQKQQNQALHCVKEWIKDQADLTNKVHSKQLQIFCFYNELFTLFYKNKFLLSLSGKITETTLQLIQEVDDYFALIADTQQMPVLNLTEEKQSEGLALLSNIHNCKKDNFSDHIENFFCNWFSSDWRQDLTLALRQRLFAFLLEPTLEAKIILADQDIDQLYNSHQEGFLDLSPYFINRILLQAIIIPPRQWSEKFGGRLVHDSSLLEGGLFPQVLDFINNNFNEGNQQIGLKLKEESYTKILMNQLTYLLTTYRKILWSNLSEEEQQKRNCLDINDEITRPKDLIILPQSLSTAQDWLNINKYISNEETSLQLYRIYRCKIEKILKEAINEIHFREFFISIPKSFQLSFITQLEDKQTQLIYDFETLNWVLKNVSSDSRIAFIKILSFSCKAAITHGKELGKILNLLPETDWKALIETLGESTKTIIKNWRGGFKLLIEQLPWEKREILITIFGEDCNALFSDGFELNNVLTLLPEKGQLALMETLGKDIKTFITNGWLLNSILEKLPEEEKIKLMSILGSSCKTIFKDGGELGEALNTIPETYWTTLIESLGESIETITQSNASTGGKGLNLVLKHLPIEKRLLLMTILGQDCKALIKDKKDLKRVLSLLPEKGQTVLMKTLGEDLKKIIKKFKHLNSILTILPEEEKIKLMSTLGSSCKTIIKDGKELGKVLNNLPEKCWQTLFEDLGENSKKIINKKASFRFSASFREGLSFVLEQLHWSKRGQLMTILGEDCKALITESDELFHVLGFLQGTYRSTLLETLGENLKTIIKKSKKLNSILETLLEAEKIKLMFTLGSSCRKIIENGKELGEVLNRLPETYWKTLFEFLGESSKTIIKSSVLDEVLSRFVGGGLNLVLKQLPIEKRGLLITILGEDCKALITDCNQLNSLLTWLPEEGQSALIKTLGESLETIIITTDELNSTQAILSQKERKQLTDALSKKSPLTEAGFFSESKNIRDELSTNSYKNISVHLLSNSPK